MNFTSLIVLLAIIFFYSWQASKDTSLENSSVWEHFKPSFKQYSGFRELLLFVVFLLLYKLSRGLAIGDEATAFANAQKVIEWEHQLGILYELPIQQYFLDKISLVKVINWIYIKLHIPTTIIFFVWLFYKKRKHYLFIRNGFLIANVITLFFFVGFPCAPPRMINEIASNPYAAFGGDVLRNLNIIGIQLGEGFIDTLNHISGINLYKGINSKLFNQFAAMPSMHFGNSLLIAFGVYLYAKNNLVRILVWIYPLFVLLVIVMTGNHFFLDAVLGGIIVLFPYAMMILIERIFPVWKYKFRGSKSFLGN
ncbi:MAG: phosphatase PAP2 family protein [Saprospiraceae bacterium]